MQEQMADRDGERKHRASQRQRPPHLCLTLPLPPSINEQYATMNGHRICTTVTRRF